MDRLEVLDWTQASCATGDARNLHLFFSEEEQEIAEAKALCRGCPLRVPCLEGAVERSEPWGVWGGYLFDRGEIIERRRRRGRPRKDDPLRVLDAADVLAEARGADEAVRRIEVA